MNENAILELKPEEIEQLLFFSKELELVDPECFCRKARDIAFQIPERIVHHFLKIYENGYILFRGIPIDYLGETPENNMENIGEKTQIAKIQGIFLQTLGEMISYEAEGNGHLFQDVVPVKNMADLQTSIGSRRELEIHTEQAFSDLRPDFLSLACIRGDPEALTYILPVSQIINNFSDSDLPILYKPLWKTGVDLSFKLLGQEFLKGDIRGPLAILHGSKENAHLLFDQDLMTGITEEAHLKIEEIVDIYYKHRIAYCLQPGEILILDNRKVVHGRSPFSPKYDGKDRFLIRAFGFTVKKYVKSEYARKERMILAKYS